MSNNNYFRLFSKSFLFQQNVSLCGSIAVNRKTSLQLEIFSLVGCW